MKPILDENCLECHSQDKRKGGLSLATYGDAAGRRTQWRGRPARQQRAQPDHRPADRRRRAADAEGRGSARRRGRSRSSADGSTRARAPTPTSPAAPQPWEAPLALDRPAACRRRSGRHGRRRSIDSSRPTWPAAKVAEPATRLRRAVRAPRVPRRLGPAAAARGAAGFPGRSHRGKARASRPDAARRQQEIRRALDLVLERSAAQRGRRHLLLGDRRAQEHHRLAATRRSRRTCRTTSSSRSCSIRSSPAIPRASWSA